MLITLLGLAAQLTVAVPTDTPPPRPVPHPRAVTLSNAYYTRLKIHRWTSYATLPLFAFQYAAGRQKWEKGDAAPAWARDGHLAGAIAIGTVFAANTVTGVWNLAESRHIETGRTRRFLHAGSMLVADAGFTWAGAVLSQQAQHSKQKKELHRTVALTSIGISVTSSTLMLIFNR